jgi:glycosyltransferase involved in cell wall biosynthesis
LSNGGAEIAAFELFQGLQKREDCEAWFLGCSRGQADERSGVVLGQPFSNREYIYHTGAFDWFKFANQDSRFPAAFESLLRLLNPDVIHFHHYINFGVEVFQHVKRILPNCKIILTLHEYLAICNHYGQMITRGHRSLCYEASPSKCHHCFPDQSEGDFFIRKLYIERYFDLVDSFISPSAFLAARYENWGIPKGKLTVIENYNSLQNHEAHSKPSGRIFRIGFFGQVSALKGMDVLMETARMLSKDHADRVTFEIYGDYRSQPPEFQQEFFEKLQNVTKNFRYHGPYDRTRVNQLMQSVHAVVVPSIWWENSPVVIQEALNNRRPVICSDIGGMAEKVRPGVDGLHFQAGSAAALASLIGEILEEPRIIEEISRRMDAQKHVAESLDTFIELYSLTRRTRS